ncbi:hypothetical protein CDD80_2860 [Ophiocordyceps camponoti-rufipedis]|uniref:Methyltransferase type 11 domain-containing protein n=1 Tax=Ophiocordyceps camponoti-rufipedis TaxID=2004952 RepID=A0A2C5Z4Y7_9HYPO|nr:hypothetical protein CDD80_2860 [Ophiocordyceps camponoti-rufipedis]
MCNNLDAEQLFDELSRSYEDAYADNPGLNKVLARLGKDVGAEAAVLDVGCGTGNPVSSFFADRGCHVTGIDVSQAMVDICSGRVKGTFVKADMTTFEPGRQFDVVCAILSMFQMPHASISSMVFRLASWLRPGGLLCLGTVTAEHVHLGANGALYGSAGDYLEGVPTPFMGKIVECTYLAEPAWLRLLQQAGLVLKTADHYTLSPQHPKAIEEPQAYFIAQRQSLDPLLGPYPLPSRRRPRFELSQAAWQPFAERLTRHEFDAVLEAVKENKKVLDVGSGHGELPIEVAKRVGQAFAIEPNGDRNGLITKGDKDSRVYIAGGTAEALPYPDDNFDAVVAMWILHYVDDLDKSLSEMARVVDRQAPEARIVLVQGAPDNEVVNLINIACAPIAALDSDEPTVDHQGFLLSRACEIFRAHGFGNITIEPVKAFCGFPEQDLSVRCCKAAEVLANFWYYSHPRIEEMKKAFIPVLERHFKYKPHEVGDQAVVLVARPTA